MQQVAGKGLSGVGAAVSLWSAVIPRSWSRTLNIHEKKVSTLVWFAKGSIQIWCELGHMRPQWTPDTFSEY